MELLRGSSRTGSSLTGDTGLSFRVWLHQISAWKKNIIQYLIRVDYNNINKL